MTDQTSQEQKTYKLCGKFPSQALAQTIIGEVSLWVISSISSKSLHTEKAHPTRSKRKHKLKLEDNKIGNRRVDTRICFTKFRFITSES